jgi:hypothetical protein
MVPLGAFETRCEGAPRSRVSGVSALSEAALERRLVEYVKRRGGYAWKLAPVSQRGLPDRLVLLPPGWVGFVELKNPKRSRLEPLQKRVGGWLTRHGFNYIRTSSWDELESWLIERLAVG